MVKSCNAGVPRTSIKSPWHSSSSSAFATWDQTFARDLSEFVLSGKLHSA
jgi:hypothetical protein